jgi:hypothetical protein
MRFKDRIAALEFLRGFLGDAAAMAALRRQLARHRSGVSSLSNHQVLAEISTLLARAPIHISRPIRLRVPASLGKEQKEPVPLRGRIVRASGKEEEEEVYVLAVAVKTIGGTPLVNHSVRILDPDTEEQVGERRMTDDDGVLRTTVPRNKTYRIEILDEEHEPFIEPVDAYEEPAYLICRFIDECGAPVANTKVEVWEDGHCLETVTDAEGKVDCCVHLGPYELKIGEQSFRAHALLSRDLETEEHNYRFVVHADGAQDEDPGEFHERLPQYDAPFDIEGQEAEA